MPSSESKVVAQIFFYIPEVVSSPFGSVAAGSRLDTVSIVSRRFGHAVVELRSSFVAMFALYRET